MVMRSSKSAIVATALVASVCSSSSSAASLGLSPVSIEVIAPGAAAVLTLRNEGTAPLNVQIRTFRWTEVDGEDTLEPTDDLVASPPMTSLAPKVNYTVRLVRLAKRPLSASESYRILVDELPSPNTQKSKVVTLLTRYSIPVFFYPASASEGKLTWSIEQRDGGSYVSATNTGDMHLRISELKVQDGNKPVISFGEGLAGYVLGHSTKTWAAPRSSGGLSGLVSLSIVAQTNYGPIRASPTLPTSR